MISQDTVSIKTIDIEPDSFLEEQLRYQLLRHAITPQKEIALPDPSIVQIRGEKYLVLTTVDLDALDSDYYPSISFFSLEPMENAIDLQISGEAEFEIPGAEVLFGSPPDKDNSLFFLTNKGLIAEQRVKKRPRMVTESVLIKIPQE